MSRKQAKKRVSNIDLVSFDINNHVRIIKQPDGVFDEEMVGLTGRIVDIDPDWHFPYEVAFDDGVDRETCLFRADQLERVAEGEGKPKNVEDPPQSSKLIYIHDISGSGGNHKNVSVIDLETGVNRLNLRTTEVDDMIFHINHHKPSQLIFDIHDRTFRKLFEQYIEKIDVGFTVKDNGEVVYHGEEKEYS